MKIINWLINLIQSKFLVIKPTGFLQYFKPSSLLLLLLLSSFHTSQIFADSLKLTGTIRDFKASHDDFDVNWGHNWWAPTTGLVAEDLGADKKPVLVSVSGNNDGDINKVISSPASFSQWFNDVPGINMNKSLDIVLLEDGDFYVYDSAITPTGNPGGTLGFFPIDGELFGDEGSPHNYHFTIEMHSQFTYEGGESFTFSGDDDVWLYIDDKLVIDLGGLHTASSSTVNLDSLGLVVGEKYDFDFFYAERRAVQSNFSIRTDIKLGSAAFTCDSSMYIASAPNASTPSQLHTVNSSASPFTFNAIGDSSHGNNYNALGYREQDDYLYGIKLETNHLLQIDGNGATKDLGPISGLPAPSSIWSSYDSGDVFPDGYLYIHQVTSHPELYKIDVTSSPPQVVEVITLSESIFLSDFTFNPVDNMVYGMGDNGEKFMIDPTTWIVSTIGSNAPPASYGAAYSDKLGNVYIYRNNPGALFKVDFGINGTGTGDMTELSVAPNVSFNDGASCRSATLFPSIKGSVFNDDNTNDTFDSTESGIANISVWAQSINTDGTLNPAKTFVTTDASGGYEFGGLPNGDYQVHVDTDDSDLPTDRLLGGSNPLFVRVVDGGVSDVNFPFDEVVCSAFTGEVSELALSLSEQLKTTDKIIIPSRDVSSATGHLRAYSVDASGTPSESAVWDASTLMTAINRAKKLYSTDSAGNIAIFNSLTEVSESVRNYTVNAPMGSISRGNDLDLVTQKLNIGLYLRELGYRDYYTNVVSTRDQMVLASSDDGFLYAFDYSSGALKWAWMPQTLQNELSANDSYQSKQLMNGSVDVLDLSDASGVYATYIVGSYKSGLGHYVLKLTADGGLDSLVWDEDQSSAFNQSPNSGEMEFFRDNNSAVYAAYTLSGATTSQLKIRSLVDDSKDISVNLSYQATSSPFVMPDYDRRNMPSKHTVYLGNEDGAIHSAPLFNTAGNLNASLIQAGLQGPSITGMAEENSDAVIHINGSISSKDNQYYLTSQSTKRLTVHRYQSTTGSWKQAWTSYASGAGSWDSDSYVEDSSGVPGNKGGFAIVPPAGIQSLPVGASITEKVTIVADSVVLPLTVMASSAANCYGKAYYYLYNLSDGKFPNKFFYKVDNSEIVDNIALGYGEASRLAITDLASTDKLVGYGVADKDLDLNSGIATSFIIRDPVTTGVRGWKEVSH